MRLTKKIKQAIIDHAKACYPLECCGLIVGGDYIPCPNICTDSNGFEIDPRYIVIAEQTGVIKAIVHSHPHSTSQASDMDKKQMALHGLPWVIVGKDGDFTTYENY